MFGFFQLGLFDWQKSDAAVSLPISIEDAGAINSGTCNPNLIG